MLTTATTLIILDTRYKKKTNLFSVKLRVTYQREQRYFTTRISLSEEDWNKMNSSRPGEQLRTTKLKLNLLQAKAEEIIQKMTHFSFDRFEELLSGNQSKLNTVYNVFEEYIAKLSQDDRVGTASSFKNALQSLKKFRESLQFSQIDVQFLEAYESWILKQGNTLTTVGFYLRSLRAIFNFAIEKGITSQELYPFGKRKYQIPQGRNIKKALSIEELEKIFSYPAEEGSNEDKAKDFWLFSYMCNGMNMKDVCRLKYQNIKGNIFTFVRAKTERTSRSNIRTIEVMITDDIKRIISKWGNKDQNPTNYIFPILYEGISPEKEVSTIRQFIKNTNKWMKRIAEKLGIDKNITTYVARHSFSTFLKQKGASTEFIQESLGHQDKRTTENYLGSFDEDTKLKYARLLTSFKRDK